ncbi:MAG: hypothetical protein ACK5NK_07250 [Niabella sp.]
MTGWGSATDLTIPEYQCNQYNYSPAMVSLRSDATTQAIDDADAAFNPVLAIIILFKPFL